MIFSLIKLLVKLKHVHFFFALSQIAFLTIVLIFSILGLLLVQIMNLSLLTINDFLILFSKFFIYYMEMRVDSNIFSYNALEDSNTCFHDEFLALKFLLCLQLVN